MKAIVIIFPTKLVTSSLLFLCFHLVKTEYYANFMQACSLVVKNDSVFVVAVIVAIVYSESKSTSEAAQTQ